MDIRELLRHIQVTPSDRAVQRATGAHRRTIQRYRAWATAQGLLAGPLPPLAELQRLIDATLTLPPPPQVVSSVEPYRSLVSQLRTEGVEIAAIWQRLKERGYTGSYAAVYRFVRTMDTRQPTVTVRVEGLPGEEAQVDFGSAKQLLDPTTGRLRTAWAFVMTLSWSRHQYVEFVFDQKVETWLALHSHAFTFFGGVPTRIVLDNLKAGITKACWDDPHIQHAYRECAEHYGFLIAPCRPRTPQHKGKVEQGGVHYVKRNFLGGRALTTLTQANGDVRQWCVTTAGQRIHGTTREAPLARFTQTEQARLQPLPMTPYDLAVWKRATVYRDCYVTFDNAYYSVPFRLVGQAVHVCGGSQTVRIYTLDYQLVATHSRAQQPGERSTHPAHLPPEKVAGLLLTRPTVVAAAADLGPATHTVVQTLLDDPVVDRLRTAGRVLQLRERYGDVALEAACARALHYDDARYVTIKRILQEGLALEPLLDAPAEIPARTFIRSASELLGHLFGGMTWN
jgi:transposase